jgi:DNA invertase Pin-like site-specific DNA recombinase
MKVLGYIRTSTNEQTNGTEAQRVRLEQEASARGWDLCVIEEHASGKTLARRPVLKQALVDLDAHQWAGLAVVKLDRLARSVLDFAAIVQRSAANEWALICLDLSLDTSTPNGRFSAHIIAAVAQLERDLIGQRTKEALSVVKTRGVRLGRPSTITAKTKEHATMLREAGLSWQKVAEALDGANVPPPAGRQWSATAARRTCA